MIALNFYRSAVEKAEKLKADKRGSVDEAYYDWLWVMCLQAYTSYCFKITESSWHFRKDILIQCYRALEFLQDMNKRYDSVDLEDTIAVTVYTIACLYYVAGDREEYLTEAKSLAKDLYKKTGKLRYKWLLKDVEKAMQSIRKKKKRLPTLEGE